MIKKILLWTRKDSIDDLVPFHLQKFDIIVMIGIKRNQLICKFEESDNYTDEEVREEVKRIIIETIEED